MADSTFHSMIRPHLCHPDAQFNLVQQGQLVCTECSSPFAVYEHVARPREENVFESCRLAEAYARSTGDVNVPCSVPIVDVPGIRPVQVLMPLRVLSNAVQLLRYANDFFRSSTPGQTYNHKIFKHFLNEYMDTIQKCCCSNTAADSPQEQMILSYVLGNVKHVLDQNLDIFEYYESKLVPYVRECCASIVFPSYTVSADTTLAQQWLMELQTSVAIRRTYGVHSLPFDVVHVMITCYACAADVDVVANIAFDLMARVSRGTFFRVDTPFGRAINKILNDRVSYKQNTALYYVVRDLKNGGARECLSGVEFLEKLGRLEKLLSDAMPTFFKECRGILDLALAKMFPMVLFNCHADYYGFMMALSHLTSCLDTKTGQCPKGSFASAKRVYDVVKLFMIKLMEFERRREGEETAGMYWTMDVFKLFLASDANLEEQIKQLSQVVVQEKMNTQTK